MKDEKKESMSVDEESFEKNLEEELSKDAGDEGEESEEVFYEVDGEKVPAAKVKEWKEAGLRQDDYTRKTQDLAEQRKEFERRMAEFNNFLEDAQRDPSILSAFGIKAAKEEEKKEEVPDYEEDPAEYLRWENKKLQQDIKELQVNFQSFSKEMRDLMVQDILDEQDEYIADTVDHIADKIIAEKKINPELKNVFLKKIEELDPEANPYDMQDMERAVRAVFAEAEKDIAQLTSIQLKEMQQRLRKFDKIPPSTFKGGNISAIKVGKAKKDYDSAPDEFEERVQSLKISE